MKVTRWLPWALASLLLVVPAQAEQKARRAGHLTREQLLAKFPQPSALPQVTAALAEPAGGGMIRGQKAVFRVTLASETPIEIAVPEKGDWRKLIRLETRNQKHERLTWDWKTDPAGAASKIAVKPGSPIAVDYVLDEAATTQLPAGVYTVDALMTAGVMGKRIRPQPVTLSVVNPGETPAPISVHASRRLAPAAAVPSASAESKSSAAVNLPAAPPKVSVYVNDSKNLEHLKGWPMIVRVGVEPSSAEAFTLSVQEGDWSKLVNVEVRDSDGALQDWAFERATLAKPASSVRIDSKNSGIATFLVPGQMTSRGNPGTYTLRAVLAMGASGKLVRSSPVTIKISEHPEQLNDEMAARREKLNAVYHALRGEKDQAIRSVENARAIPIQGPAGQPMPPIPQQNIVDGRYNAYGYSAPASSPQAGLMDLLGQFGAGSMIGDLGDASIVSLGGMAGESGEGVPDIGSIVGGGEDGAALIGGIPGTLPGAPDSSDSNEGSRAPDAPDANPPDSGNAVNHKAPNGFVGPDMTLRVESSGDPVTMHVENGEDAVGVPMTQTGPNFQQLRPWDLRNVKDTVFYAIVFVEPRTEGNAKATAKVSYQRSPNEPVQSETVELDEAKNHDSWVAFKIDCSSGGIEWIKRYHSSVTSYLEGDPEEGPSEGESPAEPAPDSEAQED